MLVKLLLIVISRTKLAEKNRLSEANVDIFYFAYLHDSQYYYLTLHSQRFATLPLRTLCRGVVRLKGNGVRVPNCEPPLYRARTKKPLKLCISLQDAWVWQECHTILCFGKAFASGRRVRRPAETSIAKVVQVRLEDWVRTTKPLQRSEGRIWLTVIIVPSCDYMYSVVITQL